MKDSYEISPNEVDHLLIAINTSFGYDFTNYARASIGRRVQRYIQEAGLLSYNDLSKQIINNNEAFVHFLEKVTVNVTEMFRDPEFYKSVRQKLIPMLESYPIIKIWHAGCSTGEEVFSMAILLEEMGLLNRSVIYATDINPLNIEKAKSGIIPLRHMRDYTSNYIMSGGSSDFSSYYTARYNNVIIDKHLRKNIVFSQHNLVTDNVFNEFQLVCCRNVMIYFNKELQNRVIALIHQSLAPLGYFALGSKESLLFTKMKNDFEVVDKTAKIYRRIN